jgi:heme-degrading monooxygenase HmoA
MIARMWRGQVATADRDRYADYMDRTGMTGFGATPGNRGALMLRRDLADGRTEFVMLSLWDTMEAVRRFAGDDPDGAVFFPEDDAFLVERDLTVDHFEVARSALPGE